MQHSHLPSARARNGERSRSGSSTFVGLRLVSAEAPSPQPRSPEHGEPRDPSHPGQAQPRRRVGHGRGVQRHETEYDCVARLALTVWPLPPLEGATDELSQVTRPVRPFVSRRGQGVAPPYPGRSSGPRSECAMQSRMAVSQARARRKHRRDASSIRFEGRHRCTKATECDRSTSHADWNRRASCAPSAHTGHRTRVAVL